MDWIILNSNDHDTTAGHFDLTPNPVLFKPDKHPVDYYIVAEHSTRTDLILNQSSVLGYLSLLEGNITKYLLPKRITNFEDNYRSTVLVSRTCLQNKPTKTLEKLLLINCLHFVVGSYYDLFPSKEVGDFITDMDNLDNPPPPHTHTHTPW